MTKTAESILRNLSNTVEWCVEPQLLSGATIDRQREQEALDQALKELESLIRTEKLKLLAEVRERVIGEDVELNSREIPMFEADCVITNVTQQNHLRTDQRDNLTKLEAELRGINSKIGDLKKIALTKKK